MIHLFKFISSASVYDFSDGRVRKEEDVELSKPLSHSGRSKNFAEELVKNSKIKSVYILRPRAVYGPGDRLLLPRILRLIKGNRMIIPGELSRKVSLTHIDNLCEAVMKSLAQARPGVHILNIADKRSYDLNAVFSEIMVNVLGKESSILIPDKMVKFVVFLNNILGAKGQLNQQTYNYLKEHSQLSIEKAEVQLNYTGKHEFYSSILQLDFRRRH